MDEDLLSGIEKLTQDKVLVINTVEGGDINQAVRIKTTEGDYFLKYNDLPHSRDMFLAEAEALRVIREKTGLSPEVKGILVGSVYSGLLMNFIGKGHPDPDSYIKAGRALANLHRHTSDQYGWHMDNYIGPIKQINSYSADWPSFYWEYRIEPLFQQAFDRQLISQSDYKLINHVEVAILNKLVGNSASFLHGDLWHGNLIFNSEGNPIFMDPASYFGNREKDLAMTKLFGGFTSEFYDSYAEVYPLWPGFEDRVPWYQLYYLLIHLLLFGSCYYGSVKSILHKAI